MSLTASGMIDRASAEISKCIMRIKRKETKKPGPETPPKPTTTSQPQQPATTATGEMMRNGVGVAVLPTTRPLNPLLPASTTPLTPRKFLRKGGLGRERRKSPPTLIKTEDLWKDDTFLTHFFLNYFQGAEKLVLPLVCKKWRDVTYSHPAFWGDLVPVLKCRELRRIRAESGGVGAGVRRRFYGALVRRGLTTLKLDMATDEDAEDVLIHFSQGTLLIQSLRISSSSLTDKGLYDLLDHLSSLRELQLLSCNELTEEGIIAALPRNLDTLIIYDCIHVADLVVTFVAKSINLRQLHLQAYHVTDSAVMSFNPKTNANLTILRLDSCWELTNQTLLHVVTGLPNLKELGLSGCSKISDEGIEVLAENLTHLRSLDLSWGPRITDASLECIACDLVCLEELYLDRCTLITDLGVGYLATMSTLKRLSLRWCSIRDPSVHHIVGIRKLKFLSLAGCVNIAPSTLCSLSSLRNLDELELTNCGATYQVIQFLRNTLNCLLIE